MLLWAFNRVRGWVLAAVGALAIAAAIYGKGRKEGRDQARRKAIEESQRRVEKGKAGAEQARKAQGKGRSPEDGVRSRDRNWRSR